MIGVPLSSPVGKYSFVHLQFTTVNGNMLSFQTISVSVFLICEVSHLFESDRTHLGLKTCRAMTTAKDTR